MKLQSKNAKRWRIVLTLNRGAATDAGGVRELNEDSILSESDLFAVADGMGGHAAGEVASGIAVATLRELTSLASTRREDVLEAIDRANAAIVAFAETHSDHSGMGTTLAGLSRISFLGTDYWLVFNVGDSRVYRLDTPRLVQLSTDHSEVEELIEAGAITPDEALVHPRRNVITKSLGMDPRPVPDTWMLPIEAGQRFLICSDGLILEVSEQDVALILIREPDPQIAADRLIASAIRAGGRDNVSAIVVDVAEHSPDGDGESHDADTSPRLKNTQPRLHLARDPQ